MNINGRYMDDGEAARRLEEIRTAVSMVPFNHPLRSLFDFLIGYVDAQQEEAEDAGAQLGLLDEAKKTNQSYEEEVQALRYRIAEIPSWCHIRATKGGGMYAFAKYEYVSPQPPAEVTRDNELWKKWTAEQTEDTKRYEAMLAELEARK